MPVGVLQSSHTSPVIPMHNHMLYVVVVAAALVVTGCATRTTLYVGIYGEDVAERSNIDRIVAEKSLTITVIDADPPAGIYESIILYGSAPAAKKLARELAYELSNELGVIVPTRFSGVANHSYTGDNVALYLIGRDAVDSLKQRDRDRSAITGSHDYQTQACSAYQAVLTIKESGDFRISGTAYDDDDNEQPV